MANTFNTQSPDACSSVPAPIDVPSTEGYSLPDGPRFTNKDGRYDSGVFAHPAAFDPLRFQRIGFAFAVSSGKITVAAQAPEAFYEGIKEEPVKAGTSTLIAEQDGVWTNADQGGYLVPPGAEGAITAMGIRPDSIFLVPGEPGQQLSVPQPEDLATIGSAFWRTLFSLVQIRPFYWDVIGKTTERILGTIDRWNAIGGLSSDQADARYPGGVNRMRSLQYKLFTGGPTDRQDAERSDRLQFRFETEGFTIPANSAGTPVLLPDGNYVATVVLEVAVDLVDGPQSRVDYQQDSAITTLTKELRDIKAALAAR